MPATEAAASPLRLAAGGLLALASAMGIGRFVYTPILPPMAEALALDATTMGLVASANYLGYLAGALLATTPWLPGDRRAWMMLGLGAGAVTTAGMSAGEAVGFFLALRFLGGLASAFVLVFASSLVLGQLTMLGRSELAAVHFAGVGTGIALSAVLTAGLAALGADWRGLWLGAGILSLALLLAVRDLIPPSLEPAGTAAGGGATRSPGGLVPLLAAYTLFGFGYIVTATFIVAIVRGETVISRFEPFVWLAVGLAAMPSVVLWNRLASAWGLPRALAFACLIEAVGVAASVLWPTVLGLFVAAALLGGTFVGITALGLEAARRLAGADPRRILALMTAGFGTGQVIGPAVAGAMADRFGSLTAPSLLAAVALVVAAGLVAGTAGGPLESFRFRRATRYWRPGPR